MKVQGPINRRARQIVWCTMFAALPPAFGQVSADPQALQTSGIAKIDQYTDYVRRTGGRQEHGLRTGGSAGRPEDQL